MPPPRNIPIKLLDKYTMSGKIPVFDWYRDDTVVPESRVWSDSYIQSFVDRFTIQNIQANCHGQETYGGASALHVSAFTKYSDSIKGKKVAVIGSETPWIEAILLNAGAASVVTVDYNKPVCSHPSLQTMTYDDFCLSTEIFDCIVSYSSIEHSGLGRYGDPLNPDGDSEAMTQMYRHLGVDGLCFLGVPVGKDELSWNVHRVYGEHRLALICKGFTELEWIGCDRNYIFTCPVPTLSQQIIQPIIVLKRGS